MEINYTIENFIGVFDNVLDHNFCDNVIHNYNKMEMLNKTQTRKQTENAPSLYKDNSTFFTNEYVEDESLYFSNNKLTQHFSDVFWGVCYPKYCEKYGILDSLANHAFYDSIKVQKTLPTQGYHIWHCEHNLRIYGSRILLVLAYLNDVEEGGETEFLYQSVRIKPRKGTMIVCPSGFTHTHRGNPPLSGVKYVMNGWVEFVV